MTYRELAATLRREITDGTRPPGARLPSQAALAHQAGVSRKTARNALNLLVRDGYAIARERSGYEVADAPAGESWQAWRDRIEERVTELERKAQEP